MRLYNVQNEVPYDGDAGGAPDISSVFADEGDTVAGAGDLETNVSGDVTEADLEALRHKTETKPTQDKPLAETPDVLEDGENVEVVDSTEGEEGTSTEQEEPTPPVDMTAQRVDWVNSVAQTYEAGLDEDTANQLRADPEKVLPRLLAQAHVNAVEQAVLLMTQALPEQVSRISNMQRAAQAAEKQFFQAWPELQDPKLAETVKASVAVYRQANPKASLQETIQQAGYMAMMKAKLPLPNLAQRFGGAADVAETVVRRGPETTAKSIPGLQPAQQSVPQQTSRPSNAEPNFFESWAEDFISGLDN